MATPFSSSMSFSSNNHIGKYHREMTALVESKCTSVVGAGVCVIEDTRPSNTKVCTNARAVVVEKQFGSDPTLPVSPKRKTRKKCLFILLFDEMCVYMFL